MRATTKKISLNLASFIFAMVFTAGGYAQESHVSITYDKNIDKTIVRSDVLYVINMPSQFMQIQFIGRYAKQGKPTQLPDRISAEFFSYAQKPMYQQDALHQLKVKADDRILDFGLLTYAKIDEKYKSKDGGSTTNPRARAGLPPNALVAATKGSALTLEIMSINGGDLGDLDRIARAKTVAMKIGETVFPLTPVHLNILREFVEAITPVGADLSSLPKPKAVEVRSDVPSAANKTSLDETLKWIKIQLERDGTTNEPRVPRRLEAINFKTCRISYRLIPRIRNPPNSTMLVYSIMEYQMDLADLNPETLRVSSFTDYASLFVATRDYQQKIKMLQHANDSGTTGRILDEQFYASTVVHLKNVDAANSIKAALVHAINLCQAQR